MPDPFNVSTEQVEEALRKDGIAGKWAVALGTDRGLTLELAESGGCVLTAWCHVDGAERATDDDEAEDEEYKEGHLRATGRWQRDADQLQVTLSFEYADEWGRQCEHLPLRKSMFFPLRKSMVADEQQALAQHAPLVGTLRWESRTFLVFRPRGLGMAEREVLFSMNT